MERIIRNEMSDMGRTLKQLQEIATNMKAWLRTILQKKKYFKGYD